MAIALSTEPADTGTHNCVIEPRLKNELGDAGAGKYGRLFPDLATPQADEDALLALGRSGAVMDDASGTDRQDATDNPCIPAGWTFFGQFIAHDITADRSLLQHHTNLDQIRNFRTPQLNLELVYAAGPSAMPYLYDLNDPDKLLLGRNDAGLPNDLPRNWQGRALVGDPRQDVHQFMSQLQLAVLTFHNRVVDWVRAQGMAPDAVFAEAQQLVRWHYQWIVAHEFLPLSVGQELMDDLLAHGPRYYVPGDRSFIPVEFADAAYRFGHSQIRALYQLNDSVRGTVFPDCAGACAVPQERVIDWRYFFDLDPARSPQQTRRIDARLVHALIDLPPAVVGETPIPEYHSLAVRDLQRGRALDLPSGEALSRYMGLEPLTAAELDLAPLGWRGETPLWYYILKESEVRANGERLGPLGGRIVAEVLLGLIDADPLSYRSADLDWAPVLPGREPGRFTMADLLRFAQVSGAV